MAAVSISLSESVTPTAEVLALDDGRRFISIRLGEGSSVIGPGTDLEQIEYARALAAALTAAADTIEEALAVRA